MFKYTQYIPNSTSRGMRGDLRCDGAADPKMAPRRSKVENQKSPYGIKSTSDAKISVAYMLLGSIQAYLVI